ncbi:MAG: F-type H+-transporting ATPase subunit delta [Marivirga sp.]|jgi:F-type H+-transporting ATPase subunit delta
MSVIRIASRYAKSLIDLSVEKNSLEQIKEDMVLLNKACTENRDLVLLLKNPIVTPDVKTKVLKGIFGGKVQELTMTFFDIVVRKRRESFLHDVAKAFVAQYNEYKNIVVAEVTTTFELTDALRKEVSKVVGEISGKSVDLVEKIDASIVGGFIIKVGDRQIDDSVSSKLKALRRDLTKNQYVKQI